MQRHGGRPLEFIPFYANQRRTIEIPRDRLIKSMSLLFRADLVVVDPGAGAAGAVNQDSILRLAPMIEVIADGTIVITRTSARMLWWKNCLENEVPGINTPPAAGAAATYPIIFEVQIPWENNIGMKWSDTYLPAPAFRSLHLNVTWGDPDWCFNAAHTMTDTIAPTGGFCPIIYETVEPAPTYIRTLEETTRTSPGAAVDFYMDFAAPNEKTVQDVLVMSTAAAAPVDLRVNTIINFLTLRSGTVRHFDRLLGLHLQAINCREMRIGAAQSALALGLYYLKCLEDGMVTSGYNLADTNTARLEMDVNAVGVDVVHTLTDAIHRA